MSAHTPGPWAYTSGGEIISESGLSIARISAGRFQQHANARLIAAAPRMLALLQEYADKARGVATPVPGSLIERTRAILRDVEGPNG